MNGQATAPVESTQSTAPQATDLHSILMESTFKIEGPGARAGTMTSGTCFLLGEPNKDGSPGLRYVLVTAAHVVDDIRGDEAVLNLRTRDAAGRYIPMPVKVTIKAQGRSLWTRHPDPNIDVAVTRVSLPKAAHITSLPLVPTTMLADDAQLMELDIHPGDELLCLGFPRGVAVGSGAFPVLRSGKIASYPLVPTSDTKAMLYDFSVFPGNSGGPVYFIESGRLIKGSMHVATYAFVAGLVTESVYHAQRVEGINSVVEEREALSLGVVIHAKFIQEAIERLPAP